jgi:PAS domain-containing protein
MSNPQGERDQKRHALLVTDDFAFSQLFQEALGGASRIRVEVIATFDRDYIVAQLRDVQCDVVLLDLRLLDDESVAALRYLHSHAPMLPLVALLPSADETITRQLVAAGVDDSLLKSDGPILLSRSLKHAIERKRLEQALLASEERFRALVQRSADMITLLDATGTLRYASASHAAIVGYKPEEMVGRQMLELVHPDDVEWQCRRTGRVSLPGGDRRLALD